MDIIISNSAGVPIYEQITQQMKGLILRGELREGEALPSMRCPARAASWPPGIWSWSARTVSAGWRSTSPRRWTSPRAAASLWRSSPGR